MSGCRQFFWLFSLAPHNCPGIPPWNPWDPNDRMNWELDRVPSINCRYCDLGMNDGNIGAVMEGVKEPEIFQEKKKGEEEEDEFEVVQEDQLAPDALQRLRQMSLEK
jgi:hypothetical protein